MKNTVIKDTGNSRYLRSVDDFLTLYPTYEAFAQALITGTLPVDILGLNASGVQQAGDPLNKATLLKDATAAMYGLPATAVPDDVLAAIPMGVNAGWKLLQEWTVAGTYTWTAPDLFGGEDYEIGVLVIGAGGSGGAASHSDTLSYEYASGGASGRSIYFIKIVTPGTTINLVVGKGGQAKSAYRGYAEGDNGGSSSFGTVSIDGGEGGGADSSTSLGSKAHPGPIGAQCSPGRPGSISGNLFGGRLVDIRATSNSSVSMFGFANECINPFECIQILGAGGSPQKGNEKGGKSLINGKGGGNAASAELGTATAESADDSGCGGGGATTGKYNNSSAYTAKSGAGADGAVKIYIRRVSA